MSLLHPTIGELLDRRTIVELKIRALTVKGGDIAPLQEELDELVAFILANCSAEVVNGVVPTLYAELGSINSRLWRLEDELRAAIQTSDVVAISHAATDIAMLNDVRAGVVRKAGSDSGAYTAEKVYSASI